ncbi:MAG: hypothetical protein DRN12_01385, partial [Thermoplasmata archaeon]
MESYRKVLVLTIIGFFIGAGVPNITGDQTICINNDDGLIMDQKQESFSGRGYPIYKNGWKYSQTFEPSYRDLTYVQLLIFEKGNLSDYQLTLSIKREPDDDKCIACSKVNIKSMMYSNLCWIT